ncbi:MAG: hypothetical protein RL685_239 [Pseudomonadota bacterium]|jgi:HEAT repeat protein
MSAATWLASSAFAPIAVATLALALLCPAMGSAAPAAGVGTAPAGVTSAAPPSVPTSPATSAPAVQQRLAERTLLVPASGEQGALALELAADGLWLSACAQAPCQARAGRALPLPAEIRAALAGAELQLLELDAGRRLAHVRVPTRDSAWEVLVAAPLTGKEPLLLFAGMTGAVRGEEGSREGEQVWIREGDQKGRRVLLGKVREEVQLCGRPTILEAQLLDRDLVLRPAKVQQLSLDERRNARVLDARRASVPTGGSNALRALAASSALGDPGSLTDGRNETSWSEGRGGDGRGEFVTFRPLSGAALVALELLVRPEGDAALPDGAAPRSFWLATRKSLFRVDVAEDAWKTPGVWYRAELPEPITDDCLAIVLESSYASVAESRVTLSEVRGVSELAGRDPAQLVARLSTPGDDGAEVVPALLQAGPAGVEAVVGAFGALDAVGRVRALDVLETGACDVVGGVYVTLLGEADARTRRRAEQRLRGCGEGVWGALREAFESSSDETGVLLGQSLSELAPALAVELLTPRLSAAGRVHRASYRDALARAAQQPEAEAVLRRALASGNLGPRGDLELLRATAELLPRVTPESTQAFARAAAVAANTFDQRYQLLLPAAALSSHDLRARAFLQLALRDPDGYLRMAAARLLPPLSELRSPLLSATRDPEVRVREASVLRLGEWRWPAAAGALGERLRDDAWPLVRAGAAQGMVGLGPSAQLDAALAGGLQDSSELVRAAVLRALGRRGARAYVPALRERLDDDEELASVRAAAAQALAELCDVESLPTLTEAAQLLLGERSDVDDMLVGSAAIAALGRLHPPDLEQRLAGFAAARHRPVLGQLAAAALQTPAHCPLPVAGSNAPQR